MQSRHFLQLVCLSAVWGASFPLIRVAAPAFGPFTMACLRCALAAVVLAALMRATRQAWPAARHWRGLTVLAAATVALPFVLYNAASLVIPAGYSAICNATAPLFGVLGGALFDRERLTARKLAGCACGLAGVALLVQLGPVQPDWRVMLAIAACISAAACYGLGAVQMKRVAHAHHPLPSSAVVHVAAALLLVPVGAWGLPSVQWRPEAVIALLVLGGLTSGLMYWISMRLMREIPASAATSSAFLIPMFGVTWGGLFLGEPVTAGMLPGVALVLVACALVTGFNPVAAFGRR